VDGRWLLGDTCGNGCSVTAGKPIGAVLTAAWLSAGGNKTMRLWTLHPKYLDRQGLLAAWREGLLAQKVLKGQTRGYTRHPQLERFKAQADPVTAVGGYLLGLYQEAAQRGYHFDRSKIEGDGANQCDQIQTSAGQLLYEWQHLKEKLKVRDPARYHSLLKIEKPEPHPLFNIIQGEIEPWERASQPTTGA
jgi:hypothetical protein